jgi:hypothetical protein
MLFKSSLEFILINILEGILIILTGMLTNLELVDEVRINVLSDKLSVMLSVSIVDPVGIRVYLHFNGRN